jgi:hypothetical protein
MNNSNAGIKRSWRGFMAFMHYQDNHTEWKQEKAGTRISLLTKLTYLHGIAKETV